MDLTATLTSLWCATGRQLSSRGSRFATFREFWRVVGELSLDSIRSQAEHPVRIALVGRPGAGKTTLIEMLTARAGNAADAARVFYEADVTSLPLPELPIADLYVYVVSGEIELEPSDRQIVAGLHRYRCPVVIAVTHCDLAADATLLERRALSMFDGPTASIIFGDATSSQDVSNVFGGAILHALPEMQLALARRLASLRPAVGNALIAESARVNAEFAFGTDLPAVIPLVGGILGGAADLLVLTKNQGMLVFKLAALHGCDLQSKVPLIVEIAPVVGAAFFWRTVARALVGILPPMVSVVPKTTIAYVGTYVVGKLAQHYYATGIRPDRDSMQRFTSEAATRFKETTTRLGGTFRIPRKRKTEPGDH